MESSRVVMEAKNKFLPFLFSVTDSSAKAEVHGSLLHQMIAEQNRELWNLLDSGVKRIIFRRITSVTKKHMRKGIAKFFATYQITPETVKQMDVQGMCFTSENK